MPLMAVQDQVDARGSTRVLASAAKKYIESVPDDERHIPAINGMFRLIKAYRVHDLKGYEYEPHPDRMPDAMSMLPPTNKRIAALRSAIELALADVAAEGGRDVVLERIEHVLRAVASKPSSVDESERDTTTRFLGSLLDRLQVAG